MESTVRRDFKDKTPESCVKRGPCRKNEEEGTQSFAGNDTWLTEDKEGKEVARAKEEAHGEDGDEVGKEDNGDGEDENDCLRHHHHHLTSVPVKEKEK